MKNIFILMILQLSFSLIGQDIAMDYTKEDGTNIKDIIIRTGDNKLIIEGDTSFRKFTVTVKNLPSGHKIIILDHLNLQIGEFITNGVKTITTRAELKNNVIKIILENENQVRKEISNIFIQVLPKSKLAIITKLPKLILTSGKVCEPCYYGGNAIIYDYSKNLIIYSNKIKWIGKKLSIGQPIVGYPFSFTVKNINPFRDSVIISNQTTNFNTDVPELFDNAFFPSFSFHGDDKKRKEEIISDVFELGEQIKRIIAAIKDLNECSDICSIIQETKDQAEIYFTKFGFDKAQTDLITFIISNLDGIAPLYRDSISFVLNNYRNFYNTKNYINYNIPQIQNVDQYNFNLSVIPKIGVKSYTVVDHQPIIINTLGGIKVDFSTGLFVTKLKDNRFRLRPDSSVIYNSYGGDSIVFKRQHQIVQLTDNKNLDFGIAALMHFYPRLTTYINLGLTLGAGVSIGPNPAIRYLGGGSLLLGRSGRLGISFGLAAGFVDVISDGYQPQDFISASDVSVITKKSFNTNSFLAVTFNIPLFKSKIKPEESNKEAAVDTKEENSDSSNNDENKKTSKSED